MDLINKYQIRVRFYFDDKNLESFELKRDNIIKVSGLKDFNNYLPITYLEVMLSERDYYYLLNYKDQLKINLQVDTYLVDDGITLEQFLSNKQPYMKNNVINHNFRPYFDDVTPFKDRQMLEKPDNFLTDESGNLKPLQLYLFLDENLDSNKNINNFIINQNNIFNSILYLCQNNDIESLIMERPDNMRTYNQIICPPLTLKKAMNYFQEVYGIYDKSLVTFKDYKNLYILPKYLKTNVTEVNECKKIIFLINEQKPSRSLMTSNTEYIEKEKTYYINSVDNLDILDNSTLEKEINGNANKIITVDDEFNTNKDTSKLKVNGYSNKEKENFIINDKDNIHAVRSYQYDIENSQVKISFNVMNVDVSFITPNKEYILVFEDEEMHKKYSGHYCLNKFSYVISRSPNGAQDLQSSCKFVLSKINE